MFSVSRIILSGIYSRMQEHVPYVFLIFWLIYMNGFRANAKLRPLRGMRHDASTRGQFNRIDFGTYFPSIYFGIYFHSIYFPLGNI